MWQARMDARSDHAVLEPTKWLIETKENQLLSEITEQSDFMNTIEKTSIHSYFFVPFFGEKKGR